ncbi:ImmA/IrrE family metallo-endopeptidase [Comamonas terrigena]|uniref:ImmA/IrrE family metallo-endopeptidase n=1 Tax=Comamonas terrigena TaxID=32013 RepID=UPI0028AB3F6F|nr:ImmA/IrrE family metallo-endopeptidase [Comamonas terrigena]
MDMPLHEGFPVAPRKRVDIRAVAQNARSILELPPGKLDWQPLLDKLSTNYGIHYDIFDKHSAPVPMAVEACFVPGPMTIYIRDSVFDQLASGGQRATFTMGHELGHVLLAHQRTHNRLTRDVPIYCHSEWQANIFAAEFTMPLPEIQKRSLRTAEAISNFFGVSPAAATTRLADLRKKGEI